MVSKNGIMVYIHTCKKLVYKLSQLYFLCIVVQFFLGQITFCHHYNLCYNTAKWKKKRFYNLDSYMETGSVS